MASLNHEKRDYSDLGSGLGCGLITIFFFIFFFFLPFKNEQDFFKNHEYVLKAGEELSHGDIIIKSRNQANGFQLQVTTLRRKGEKIIKPNMGTTYAFGYYITLQAVIKGNVESGETDSISFTVWGGSKTDLQKELQ